MEGKVDTVRLFEVGIVEYRPTRTRPICGAQDAEKVRKKV